MGAIERIRAELEAATGLPWEPYFTIHGDPYVVPAGLESRRIMHQIASVSTAPDDYAARHPTAANPPTSLRHAPLWASTGR